MELAQELEQAYEVFNLKMKSIQYILTLKSICHEIRYSIFKKIVVKCILLQSLNEIR